MRTWHFYGADGFLLPQQFCGAEQHVAENTPEGCTAIEGSFDHLSQRVEAGAVVGWQPPAPVDDATRAWAWDGDAKRWVATPTIAAVAADVRLDRAARLAACDWVAARSVETSQPIPPEWAAYRKALRDVSAQAGFPTEIEWPASPWGA